ncbi:unnamed protein product [Cuscuta campestris]|uniref:MULE transposase domain-containing protein n=1 Tax=Cuscuta campestris TaxID=132261 RepID=A0A484M245_9ASTE|nr:unnamed protein product [Cuscuta campestris]
MGERTVAFTLVFIHSFRGFLDNYCKDAALYSVIRSMEFSISVHNLDETIKLGHDGSWEITFNKKSGAIECWKVEGISVHLDHKHMGLGGDDSWSPCVHDQYLLPPVPYSFCLRFDSEHSCPVDFREGNHRQATSTLLAGLVSHRYADASKKPYQPIDLMDDMRREYGITMSYKKALVVKRKAMSKLYGSDDQLYRLLPAMQAWIHCFPILIIDGTFMKAYFRGTLLTACTQDANRQIVPLAFGICDAENNESWLWFLSNVKHSLIERSDMCIISDRHDGILFAVDKLFPSIPHCYCTEHILRNLKGKFKGKSESIEWKFRAASRAATVEECEEYLSMLDDPRIRVYLDKIGVAKWSRYKSPTSRYSSMTSNLAELMNNVNKNAWDYSVAKLVEFLRAIGKRPGLSCYEFISTFYKLEALVCTYAGIVHPIGDVSGWVIPQDILSRKCDPPSYNKRPPGRPKKKRYPSVGELRYGKRRVKQRCSRCKSHGHNMKSCTNPIPMADVALT